MNLFFHEKKTIDKKIRDKRANLKDERAFFQKTDLLLTSCVCNNICNEGAWTCGILFL